MPIKLENVSYTYDAGTTLAVRALRGVTLDAADGEFIGVMGAAGSGKSTLIQLIAGLIKPTVSSAALTAAAVSSFVSPRWRSPKPTSRSTVVSKS